MFCHSVGCNIFDLRIREDHLHAVREELSNLRKHISALSSKERDVLEASMKTVSEENQAFMKKHLRDETKSLKEDVQKISRENQALKTQLEEVLHILRSQTPQGMVL
jgi:DNA repair exonuclease SbcCD ATPase subunit